MASFYAAPRSGVSHPRFLSRPPNPNASNPSSPRWSSSIVPTWTWASIARSGQGEVFSCTTMHNAPAGFAKYAPYTMALVELAEGQILYGYKFRPLLRQAA